MKMYCKYCEHEKNGSKLLLGIDKEMINCPVSHHFLCSTCGTGTTDRGFPNSNEGDISGRKPAQKMICHPLPSAFRNKAAPASSQQVSCSSERITGAPRFMASAPLAMRTFHVDEFAFGAVSTTFTLGLSTPPAYPPPPLSSSPESGSSGDLLKGIDTGRDGDGHRTFSRRTLSWLKERHKCPWTFTIPKDASIFAGVRSKVSERASSEQEVVNQPAAPKEGLDVDMVRILNQLEATMRQIV